MTRLLRNVVLDLLDIVGGTSSVDFSKEGLSGTGDEIRVPIATV